MYKNLAQMIKNSKYLVVHTGAGISTSASIPDFRGPKGVWRMEDLGLEPEYGVDFEDAYPTLTHMALVQLQNRGILKHLVSQNVDGLHLRSGIKRENLSELHGNVYLEICKKCDTPYLRDFDVAAESDDTHKTGRKCDNAECAGPLVDSIIDFYESLPKKDLQNAREHSKQADLCIVVGSSLEVTPACEIPLFSVKNQGKLVIVNLQKTRYDDKATLRIFGKSDDVFRMIMQQLELPIPSFFLKKKMYL